MTLLERGAAILSQHQVRHALVGAAALAAYGVSRSTVDQDLLVNDRRVLELGGSSIVVKTAATGLSAF